MIIWIVLTLIIMSALIFGLGWMACGHHVKKDYFCDKDEQKKFGDYMKAFWVTEPSSGNLIFFLWVLALATILFCAAMSDYKYKTLKKYDEGEIVKVVTYTTEQKPGKEPVRDSTFRYEPK